MRLSVNIRIVLKYFALMLNAVRLRNLGRDGIPEPVLPVKSRSKA
jgi:hypothetical protein